jgi:pyruvate formate lyase activating enzyme
MRNIKGFLETSFIDWPGRSCGVIFLGGCNFRCPFCHNHPLVLQPQELLSLDLEDILGRLRPWRAWLGGVCVSGGEPTLSVELPELLRRLKAEGFRVKLDTNGSRPAVLANLLTAGLIDMIAMDVKAPLEQALYDRCCGVSVDLVRIRKSIDLLLTSGVAHQFRMTVVPGLHDAAVVRRWRQGLGAAADLKLQNYSPRSVLDPASGTGSFTEKEFADLVEVLEISDANGGDRGDSKLQST